MLGTQGLPKDWVKRLDTKILSALNVHHTDALLTDFAEDTCRVGVEMAAARNSMIQITGAPTVPVRPAPAPAPTIEIDYPTEPVLWQARATPVRLILDNPGDRAAAGTLQITPAGNTRTDLAEARIEVPPRAQKELTINVWRQDPRAWLPDKNLFDARWIENDRETRRTFGLGGARQWQVYGPYWDAWDRTKNPVCPYYNEAKTCHPGHIGFAGDSYTHHVQFDHPDLDENRLIREDIPAELPLSLEAPEDLILETQLGGFTGPAVYYFVRTIRAVAPRGNFCLMFGRVGPIRVWFDGKEVAAREGVRPWCPVEFDEQISVNLDGRPQRLVVKALRLTDAFRFSLMVIGTGDPERKCGISWMHDGLEDQPAAMECSGESGRHSR